MAVRTVTALSIALAAFAVGAAAGCGDVNAELEELSQARQLSADLLVQFTKAADAANRAVMADTDDASIAFAHEAEQAKQAVHRATPVTIVRLELNSKNKGGGWLCATRTISYDPSTKLVSGGCDDPNELLLQSLHQVVLEQLRPPAS